MKITKFEKNNKDFIISIEGVTAIITNILSKYSKVDSSNIYHCLSPDFHDIDGGIHENNQLLKDIYHMYTNYSFFTYSNLVGAGVPEKDARYILPLTYTNNTTITCNKKELISIVSNLLTSNISNIEEVEELSFLIINSLNKYYPNILEVINYKVKHKKDLSYLDDELEKIDIMKNDEFLDTHLIKGEYDPSLLSSDFKICVYYLMKKYNMTYEAAYENTHRLMHLDIDYKRKLIYHLINNDDFDILSHINYHFEYNISLQALKEIDTKNIIIPDLIPIKTEDFYLPHSINNHKDIFISMFKITQNMVQYFIEKGVREEDLIYFYLGCNTLNVTNNINAKELLELSNNNCCEKKLEEIRTITYDMINKAKKETPIIGDFYGPSCEIEGICIKRNPCYNIDEHFNNYFDKKEKYENLDSEHTMIFK